MHFQFLTASIFLGWFRNQNKSLFDSYKLRSSENLINKQKKEEEDKANQKFKTGKSKTDNSSTSSPFVPVRLNSQSPTKIKFKCMFIIYQH